MVLLVDGVLVDSPPLHTHYTYTLGSCIRYGTTRSIVISVLYSRASQFCVIKRRVSRVAPDVRWLYMQYGGCTVGDATQFFFFLIVEYLVDRVVCASTADAADADADDAVPRTQE